MQLTKRSHRTLLALCLLSGLCGLWLLSQGCSAVGYDCRDTGDCDVGQICHNGWCKAVLTDGEQSKQSETSPRPEEQASEPSESADGGDALERESPDVTPPGAPCQSWKSIRTLKEHKGLVRQVVFGPRGKLLYSAGTDNTIKIWDVASGTVKKTLTGHQDDILALVVDKMGDWLVSGSADRTVKIWDLRLESLAHTLKDHKGEVTALALSPDGSDLITGDKQGMLLRWPQPFLAPSKSKVLQAVGSQINAIAYQPDGKGWVSAHQNGQVEFWDTRGTRVLPYLSHPDPVAFLVFFPDGSKLITSTNKLRTSDGQLWIWSLDTRQPAKEQFLRARVPVGVSMAHSPVSPLFATIGKSAHLWDMRTLTEFKTLPAASTPYSGIAFSADGKMLAFGEGFEIKIWECQRCKPDEKVACYTGKPGTKGVGACGEGIRQCQADGTWGTCKGAILPIQETCNGKDDNCDGSIDEGFTPTPGAKCNLEKVACSGITGVGKCKQDGTGSTCIINTSQHKESCDGLDNNCDGTVDETCTCKDGETQPCHPSPSQCLSSEGKLLCFGICGPGTQTCKGSQWGTCKGYKEGALERCNGTDDDCDGLTDEDFATKGQSCTTGKGGCQRTGTLICNADGSGLKCDAQAGAPATETCNGIDDDCDGSVDEGCTCTLGATQPCISGNTGCNGKNAAFFCKGACKSGTQTCESDGQGTRWGACTGSIMAQPEACDGQDNDCDGQIDELPGCVFTLAGSSENPFGLGAYDLTIDQQGTLYFTDGRTVRKFSKDNIEIIAGSSIQTPFVRDGKGSKAILSGVDVLVSAAQGNLYLADKGCVRQLSPDATVTTIAGGCKQAGDQDGPALQARFQDIADLAVGQGTVYIADADNDKLRKLSGGQVSTIAGHFSFKGTTSLALDSRGNLYVSDYANHQIHKVTPGQVVTTIAGSGSAGLRDGDAKQALFNGIVGLVLDPTGSLFIADTRNQRIRKLSPDGNVSTTAGSVVPRKMARHPDGSIYYTENHMATVAIKKRDLQGRVTTVYQPVFCKKDSSSGAYTNCHRDGPARNAILGHPVAIAPDAKGGLILVGARIRYLSPDGVMSTIAGDGKCTYDRANSRHIDCYRDGPGHQAQFNHPTGAAIDAAGHIYIADTVNHRIRKISHLQGADCVWQDNGQTKTEKNHTGYCVTTYAGDGKCRLDKSLGKHVDCDKDGPLTVAQFHLPRGLSFAANGDLYVTDSGNSKIRRITTQGVVETFASAKKGQCYVDGVLNSIHGIAIGPQGSIYITDSACDRIYKYTTSGRTLLAGHKAGYQDGIGQGALFDEPMGLTVDARGNVYVADRKNHRIRRIEQPSGRVTTYVGLSNTGGYRTYGYLDGMRQQAYLFEPQGLALRGNELYIADTTNLRIRLVHLP